MPTDPCPSPDEIMSWAMGDLRGQRGVGLGLHVASCEELCGEYLHTSTAIMGAMLEGAEGKPERRSSMEELVHRAKARRQDVDRLFGAHPSTWISTLAAHPESTVLDFLYLVADRAVYHAVDWPDEMLAFLEGFRDLVDEASGEMSDRQRVLSLTALAEGVVCRTHGDHLRALALYAEAEQLLPFPGLDVEHPRILLARASSLRRLNRIDEARETLDAAYRSFDVLGVAGGAKALWELANLAWEVGRPRAAVRLACRAHRELRKEGSPAEASVMLLTVAAGLLDLRRLTWSGRILDRLRHDPAVTDNPYEAARLRWHEARLATARLDLHEGLRLYQEAADMFAAVGAVLDAVGVLLQMAVVAGELGLFDQQLAAASRAAVVARSIPGQAVDWARAIGGIQEAAARGSGVAASIALAQHLLRRR